MTYNKVNKMIKGDQELIEKLEVEYAEEIKNRIEVILCVELIL